MAIAIDNISEGTPGGTSTTLSWTHTVTAALSNSILVVVCGNCWTGPPYVTGVNWDDGGTPEALTFLGSNPYASVANAEIWYLKNLTAGTKTIKVTWSASCETHGGAISLSGVDQTTPWNAASPQKNQGTATAITLTVTSATGELVIDSFVIPESGYYNLTPTSPQAEIYFQNTGSDTSMGGGSSKAGAASVSMEWTTAEGDSWSVIGGSLRPSGLPGRNPVPMGFVVE